MTADPICRCVRVSGSLSFCALCLSSLQRIPPSLYSPSSLTYPFCEDARSHHWSRPFFKQQTLCSHINLDDPLVDFIRAEDDDGPLLNLQSCASVQIKSSMFYRQGLPPGYCVFLGKGIAKCFYCTTSKWDRTICTVDDDTLTFYTSQTVDDTTFFREELPVYFWIAFKDAAPLSLLSPDADSSGCHIQFLQQTSRPESAARRRTAFQGAETQANTRVGAGMLSVLLMLQISFKFTVWKDQTDAVYRTWCSILKKATQPS